MLVTVITLSYNSNNTLKTAIDSVLGQSYDAIQYIVSDDGTIGFDKQKVEEYIRDHRRRNIKEYVVLHGDKNIGTIRNVNRALGYAKGEIVFNLSADDSFFDEEVVADWVNEFVSTKAEVITAKRAIYDEVGGDVVSVEPHGIREEALKKYSPEKLFEFVAPVNIIFGCCTARTMNNINKYGGYDERYKYIEDYSFNLRYLRSGGKIHFFDRIAVKYTFSGISTPSRVGKVYLKENYRIFKNEALPYVKDKRAAKQEYKKWKKSLIFDKRVKWLRTNCDSGKSFLRRAFAYFIFYAVWYPVLGIKRVVREPKVLLKFIRKERHENTEDYFSTDR